MPALELPKKNQIQKDKTQKPKNSECLPVAGLQLLCVACVRADADGGVAVLVGVGVGK